MIPPYPRCGIWDKPYTHRCPNAARYRLMHPGGVQFLGDLVCPDHAARFIELYAEGWTGRPPQLWDAVEIDPATDHSYGEFPPIAPDSIDSTPYRIPPIPSKEPKGAVSALPKSRSQRPSIDVASLNAGVWIDESGEDNPY